MRDGFIFYRSFVEAAKTLNNRERLQLYDSIALYALDDIVPEVSGAARGMFYLIKPQIDANNKRYASGRKGGRPKAEETETKAEPKQNQSITKTKPNDNQNVTKGEPKEKEKEKEKEKDKEKEKGKWVDETIPSIYKDNLYQMRSRIQAVNEGRR